MLLTSKELIDRGLKIQPRDHILQKIGIMNEKPKLYFDLYYRDHRVKHPSFLNDEEKKNFDNVLSQNEALFILVKDGKVHIEGISLEMGNYIYRSIYNCSE